MTILNLSKQTQPVIFSGFINDKFGGDQLTVNEGTLFFKEVNGFPPDYQLFSFYFTPDEEFECVYEARGSDGKLDSASPQINCITTTKEASHILYRDFWLWFHAKNVQCSNSWDDLKRSDNINSKGGWWKEPSSQCGWSNTRTPDVIKGSNKGGWC